MPIKSQQPDRFVHDRLPAPADWPELTAAPPSAVTAEPQPQPQDNQQDDSNPAKHGNAITLLLDRHSVGDAARHTALVNASQRICYAQLNQYVNKTANMLRERFTIIAGNRVLIRGYNSIEFAIVFLATLKIGAIAVNTMPLLRGTDLGPIIEKAQPQLIACDSTIADPLAGLLPQQPHPPAVLLWDPATRDLLTQIDEYSASCTTLALSPQDIALLAFTSGTTGAPKATVHSHQDLITVCEVVGGHLLRTDKRDRFIGTSPLAFTFGLGGLLLFPLYYGASTVLLPTHTPASLLAAIEKHQASLCFTVPTFYQRLLALDNAKPADCLRLAISSGEALAATIQQRWQQLMPCPLVELMGATEMLHAFAAAPASQHRAGYIGPALPGYQLAILDRAGNQLEANTIGRLAVKGPTGCRYLDDPRQQDYVQAGWNITGDSCALSTDGWLRYIARSDDMIISSGYNISGIEVENALLEHRAVNECAVVAKNDTARGQIVVAHVVSSHDFAPSDELITILQQHVKARIAPYKYPREIHFVSALPRNHSGKLQRHLLR